MVENTFTKMPFLDQSFWGSWGATSYLRGVSANIAISLGGMKSGDSTLPLVTSQLGTFLPLGPGAPFTPH